MKIGILTHWTGKDNYGQMLQCYALQQYLKQEGHTPFLVRYIAQMPNVSIKRKVLFFWRYLNPLHIVAYIRYRIGLWREARYYREHNPEQREFDTFRNRYIAQSSKLYYSIEELREESWSVDAFIVGSDQVWNCPSIHRPIYFLQFAPGIKKIAYAASFGKRKLDEGYKAELPLLLDGLHSVGVREMEGLSFCHHAGRMDAEIVCDPTLLLSRRVYLQNLLGVECLEDKRHVFCYFLNWETHIPTQNIKCLARENSLDIVYFNAHALELKNFVEPYHDLTIESWIRNLASAQYVCTNSFHGMVFSIIMRRNFVVLPLQGMYAGMNSRMTTFLNRIGLADRICCDDSNIKEILIKPIDWNLVGDRLTEFVNLSKEFLNDAI